MILAIFVFLMLLEGVRPMADPNAADSFDPTIYEMDTSPKEVNYQEDELVKAKQDRIAVIRTTDRMVFRRCRRRWGWSSHLRGNLGSREGQSPLWLGTGFHFALEDFHGKNFFGKPSAAFKEYVKATRRFDEKALPGSWQEDADLAIGMLDYYSDTWLSNRSPLETFVWKGQPQVEVNFRIELPWERGKYGYDRVQYSGTLDRVIIDENGLLWIVEYKTAKSIQTLHLANDSQVSSYCWAGMHLYDRPVAGVIYQQHRKDLPKDPKILGSGRLSTDKRQLITAASLRQSLIRAYGAVTRAPMDYIDFLNYLIKDEAPMGDKFILRTKIQRNQHQCEAEGVKILMEADEMLNPELALYPNPDRTCQFMCPFNGSCVSLDDGGDWEYELSLMFKSRDPVYDSWRKKVRLPGTDTTSFLTIDHVSGENSNG